MSLANTQPGSNGYPVADFKVVNDPVHGHFDLHPLLVAVMDTPQFQRLRHLKQLGLVFQVFPSASHCRFEHSLGVAHLAGELVKRLHNSQPELGITSADILCVQLAGLCHDLGHGPYSHLWEMFLAAANPGRKWRHEATSVTMFRYLISSNPGVQVAFDEYQLGALDIEFVCELIDGPQAIVKTPTDYWPYLGRSRDKSFLYQIVANKKNGVDVDKWDYFVRDSYYLGVRTSFDHNRLIKFAAVVDGDICFREKECDSILEMFQCRARLHRTAYWHKAVTVFNTMFIRALLLADEHLTLPGTNGSRLRLSECHTDLIAWSLLTDHVYHLIRSADLILTPQLAPAVELLNRIETRKIYKIFGEANISDGKSAGVVLSSPRKCPARIVQEVFSANEEELSSLGITASDIEVMFATISCGGVKSGSSPLETVKLYSKNSEVSRDGSWRKECQKWAGEVTFIRVMYLPVECSSMQQVVLATAWRLWCEERHCSPGQPGETGDTTAEVNNNNNNAMKLVTPTYQLQSLSIAGKL